MPGKLYAIDQCGLYKIQSKRRLASILHCSLGALNGLSKNPKYRQFTLPAEICPFTGSVKKARDVQAPWDALRPIHERVHELLRRVEPPSYAHAAIRGRSYRTNADAHKSSTVVATFDIRSFYPSTRQPSVFRFFRENLKCSVDVSALLSNLLCFPGDKSRWLPTGSPASPLLSIYANLPLFEALNKLALTHGLTFTCYVDDITFSGKSLPIGLGASVNALVREFGHRLHDGKTRRFGPADAKHVTGVVIQNGKISVPNSRFLKARKIEVAILRETDLMAKLPLMQKLAGLLGEAAFLDVRYRPWAQSIYRQITISSYTSRITQSDGQRYEVVTANEVVALPEQLAAPSASAPF